MVDDKSRFADKERRLVVLAMSPERAPVPSMFRAIAERAKAFGWKLLDLRFTYGEVPDGRNVEGALTDALPPDRVACSLRDLGCPLVRIGYRPHPQDHLMPAVLPDLALGARMAVDHFVQMGLTHVGFAGRHPLSNGRVFFEYFEKCALASKCECHLAKLPPGPDHRGARYSFRVQALREWLVQLPKPIGVMAPTDRDAALICTVCEDVGLSIPEEVAVLGSGNNELDCEIAPVALSSIDWAKGEQGARAATLLKELMDGQEPPKAPELIKSVSVVARSSTARGL